jgi:O-methyltransferase
MRIPLRHLRYLIYRLGLRTRILRAWLSHAADMALRESIIRDFIDGGYGSAYGVAKRDRAMLVEQFDRNVTKIQSGTSALMHIVMAREILAVPPHVVGEVIECGVWKGASAASLSLICDMVGRRLLVCDSFAGLPGDEPSLYRAPHTRIYGYLRPGMFCGGIDEVRENISACGKIDVCDFLPGLFAESLTMLTRPLVFAFLDVDLPRSFEDCLRAIWPLLTENAKIYVDDAGCMEIVRIFFDDVWWQQNLGCLAPGFVGSGCGLPITPNYSNVGYTCKLGPFLPALWRRDSDLYYPDSQEIG